MTRETLSDIAWDRLFNHFPIIQEIDRNGIYQITASEINQISGRQARLMTKFDHKQDRPKLFKRNGLSILPDTRGTYLIAKFKAYAEIEYEPIHPIRKILPPHLNSLDIDNITSEAVALNVAHASGMIDDVMDTFDVDSVLTLSGRMSSTEFDYDIDITGSSNRGFTLSVVNSQIEIDGSYETLERIAVIEAKNRIPEDFMIRQIYYPYRMYINKNLNKEIMPIFFTYADDIFSFHIYEFVDPFNYSSINKVGQMDFVLNETLDITHQEVDYISNTVNYVSEESTIFPQANNFTRVMDMLDFLEIPKDKYETADFYKFAERQSDYYFNSLNYLGFAERRRGKYTLTELGMEVQKMRNSKQRNLFVIRKILEHKPFNEIYKLYGRTGGYVEIEHIMSIVYEHTNITNPDTCKRRSGSALMWIEWVYSNIE